MKKEEIAEIITKKASEKGIKALINPDMIQELEQSSYYKERNCMGLKLYAVWFSDKVFILTVLANGFNKLHVLDSVIM